ncbi:peptidylprolyl isomerase [Nautilia lithotrophica]
MKKIIFSLSLIFLLHAEVIDKIVATVNNIPITSYEVEKLSKNLNISYDKALQYLLDQKLIQSEIKKRGIEVDDFEIENAMEKVAKQNGLSLFEFKNILMQKGQYDQLRNKIKEDLLKEKLFNEIVQTKLKITPDEIKNYYDNHKDEFKVFKSIQVTKYTANNKQALNDIKKNPLANYSIQTQTKVYDFNELPLGLLFLFKQTKVGEFTPIINDGLNYSMYYIARKDGANYIPFDKVKNIIANKLIAQKREMILKDYFNKLKNRAYIKFYN